MYTTYLCGAMEQVSGKVMKGWREIIEEQFEGKNIFIYNPINQEPVKVGLTSQEYGLFLKNLKKRNRIKEFFKSLWYIYFNSIPHNHQLVDVLKNIRMNKLIYGNTEEQLLKSGDLEAVCRSDFIIAYLPYNHKTVGSYYEITIAFLFNIPIYLVVPDKKLEDINSSLLFGVMVSGGKFFYSLDDCINTIKKDYF